MSLDKIIDNNTVETNRKTESGVCPKCKTEGKSVERNDIEYKCTTSIDQCEVLYWIESKNR